MALIYGDCEMLMAIKSTDLNRNVYAVGLGYCDFFEYQRREQKWPF